MPEQLKELNEGVVRKDGDNGKPVNKKPDKPRPDPKKEDPKKQK